jgi:hypothetical protein
MARLVAVVLRGSQVLAPQDDGFNILSALKPRRCRANLGGHGDRRETMKRILAALAVTFAFGSLALIAPVHAVPPTATPSPGYDARLQESRSGTTIYTPAPRPPKQRKKRVQPN